MQWTSKALEDCLKKILIFSSLNSQQLTNKILSTTFILIIFRNVLSKLKIFLHKNMTILTWICSHGSRKDTFKLKPKKGKITNYFSHRFEILSFMTKRICYFIALDYTLYVRFNSYNRRSFEGYCKPACYNLHITKQLEFEKRTKKIIWASSLFSYQLNKLNNRKGYSVFSQNS